jgi:Fe2+ transport system protein FeoA
MGDTMPGHASRIKSNLAGEHRCVILRVLNKGQPTPIPKPPADCCAETETCPLSSVEAGTTVCIKQLTVKPDVLNRLREMGLGEEQRIRLISRHPSLICQVCNARVALSKELAESILVEPLRKAS